MKKTLMKKSSTLFIIAMLLTIASQPKDALANSFAVVELFTSEGCSSCPPADALLVDLTKEARKNNDPIYTLSFHVDYWNYLGWRDPFSDKQHSARQRKYAAALKSRSAYTPQMIINGTNGFVGSGRARAKAGIKEALKTRNGKMIRLSVLRETDDEIELQYSVSSVDADTVINFALVERDLSREVTRGENSGRTLFHENVVRSYKTVQLLGSMGKVTIKKPKSVNYDNASIISYIQNKNSLAILGANSLDLS